MFKDSIKHKASQLVNKTYYKAFSANNTLFKTQRSIDLEKNTKISNALKHEKFVNKNIKNIDF